MLTIFLSIVVFTSSGKGSEEIRYRLMSPALLSVSAVEPAGLYVQWGVVNQRQADPVIGTKIRIYEVPESSESELKLINAEQYPVLVKNDIPSQKFMQSTNLTAREVIINGPKTEATIDGIKYNTLYEVRVLAFKRDGDGPLSEPIRIKVLKDTEYHAVVTRTVTGCQISLLDETNEGNEEERLPYVYKSDF